MKSASNFVSVNGLLSEKKDDYYTLKSIRRSGQPNLVRIWNLPDDVEVGDRVNVVGELDFRPLFPGFSKKVLGVKADVFFPISEEDWEDNKAVNDLVKIVGEIVSDVKLRITPISNRTILELTIKAEKDMLIPVIVWDMLAKRAVQDYKKGDTIQIEGRLCSREYDKFVNGEFVGKQLTMEVNANIIRAYKRYVGPPSSTKNHKKYRFPK